MRWFLPLLLLLPLLPNRASAGCPTAWYSLFWRTGAESSAAFGDVFDVVPETQAIAEVLWNAVTGRLMARTEAMNHHTSGSAEIRITDDFHVLGAPAGSPVRVTAALEVDGASCQPGYSCPTVGASISDTAGHEASSVSVIGSTRLELPIELLPGVAQRLRYGVSAYASADGVTGHVRLTFPDLPSGMSIVSCGGFQTGAVTATRPTTWARLKQIYR